MAAIEPLRPAAPALVEVAPAPLPPAPSPAAFAVPGDRTSPDGRLAGLLAFALAAEAEEAPAPAPEAVARRRREAEGLLHDQALRLAHNRVAEIRAEAVSEHLGRLRPPPGFGALVAANLVALLAGGAALAWALPWALGPGGPLAGLAPVAGG